MPGLLLVVTGIGHDPAEDAHLAVESLCDGRVLVDVLVGAYILFRPRQLHHVVAVVGVVDIAMPVAIVGHELATFRGGGVHEELCEAKTYDQAHDQGHKGTFI